MLPARWATRVRKRPVLPVQWATRVQDRPADARRQAGPSDIVLPRAPALRLALPPVPALGRALARVPAWSVPEPRARVHW